MTILLNLESYSELCYYTQNLGLDDFEVPIKASLPISYLDFLKSARKSIFIKSPLLMGELPKSLELRNKDILYQQVGDNLDDGIEEDLLIIRDIDVLSLRGLQDRYLYASAYRYWNFVSQLSPLANDGKPLVIYDLDSLPCPYHIPITFRIHKKLEYPIPIFDMRKVEDFSDITLPFSIINFNNEIHQTIAQKICIDAYNQLGLKLKKTSIIKYLWSTNFIATLANELKKNKETDNFNLILHTINDQLKPIYFKLNISLRDLESIILTALPTTALKNIALNHPDYNFTIISPYNNFNGFRSALAPEFFLPDIHKTEFARIWQQKLSEDFPLYGQYLDQISFLIKGESSDKNIEICVPNELDTKDVYFEGDNDRRVFAGKYYLSNGDERTSFIMRSSEVFMPIKINGKVRKENGKEQVYFVTNKFHHEDKEISVEILFYPSLGQPPKLEVIDEKGRKLDTRQGEQPESPKIGYIPIEKISEDRYSKAKKSLSALSSKENFIEEFNTKFIQIFDVVNNCIPRSSSYPAKSNHNAPQKRINYINMFNIVKEFYENFLRDNQLQYISPSSIPKVKDAIIKLNYFPKSLEDTLDSLNKTVKKKRNEKRDQYSRRTKGIALLYDRLILTVGKMYTFSSIYNYNFLFEQIDNMASSFNLGELIKVLARISDDQLIQSQFFALFNKINPRNKRYFYQDENYIWGYARVLLWYYSFSESSFIIDYHNHFKGILNYLHENQNSLSENKFKSYYQASMISLIYLLTFRQYDNDFCHQHSSEYFLAKDTCIFPAIYAYQISKEKSLNEIFGEFLEGTASDEDVFGMFEIDS